MDHPAYLAVLLLATALVVAAFCALARWARRRGAGHAVLGPFDEVFHPSGTHRHEVVQQEQERLTPAPAPGARLRPRGRR